MSSDPGPVRYVVYGAGAIGGTIGALLFEAGRDVTLVARGRHLDALRSDGLNIATPAGSRRLAIAAVGHPAEAGLEPGDVVILAMKSQDVVGALEALVSLPSNDPGDVSVVCAQNGVESERLALRRFPNVYGMVVMLPADHLEPGTVAAFSANTPGILDVGRYPHGVDAVAEQIASDLEAAGFSAQPDPAIMRWKYAKLLMNLANALDAASSEGASGSDLHGRARDEAVACLRAAGIDYASEEEFRERRGDHLQMRPVGEEGRRYQGGSSWQSLARGTGTIEADYLNGEIVLLGRLHGIATPVNAALQRVANQMAARGAGPGTVDVEEIERLVRQA